MGSFIDADVVTVPGTIVEQLLVAPRLSIMGLGVDFSLAAPLDEFPIMSRYVTSY